MEASASWKEPAVFVREIAFRKADALDQTFGEQFAGLGFHVDHLVFDRRTAAVEY